MASKSTAFDLRRDKHLVDVLASTNDAEQLENRLIDLCEKWGVEIAIWGAPEIDIEVLDFGSTVYNLAKHAQAHASEQLKKET